MIHCYPEYRTVWIMVCGYHYPIFVNNTKPGVTLKRRDGSFSQHGSILTAALAAWADAVRR